MADLLSTKAWMPFYVADYIADTTRLTTEQHGAYVLLLLDYWRTGPLPDDDQILAQITRLPLATWRKSSLVIRAFFTKWDDGLLHQKRADAEKLKAGANRVASSEKAARASRKRWDKSITNDASSNAPSIPPSNALGSPQAMPEQCPSPAPSPTPSSETKNQEQIPSPVGELILAPKPRKMIKTSSADPRHSSFKELVMEHYQAVASMDAPWGAPEGKQLHDLLAANPSLTKQDFECILTNRSQSAVTLSERPSKWLSNATAYLGGPLDRYGKPATQGETTNGTFKSKSENTLAALRRSIARSQQAWSNQAPAGEVSCEADGADRGGGVRLLLGGPGELQPRGY